MATRKQYCNIWIEFYVLTWREKQTCYFSSSLQNFLENMHLSRQISSDESFWSFKFIYFSCTVFESTVNSANLYIIYVPKYIESEL